MKETEEADVIVEQAFENEQNLRLAAKVGLAFPSVKRRIVREFVQCLAVGLETRLGQEWIVEDYWTEDPLQAGCQIALVKKPWADGASIGLECDKAGPSELLYFVWRESKQKSPTVTDLKRSLDECFSHGNHYSPSTGGDTLWWKSVDGRYRDWNNENMLVALWKKKNAVEYYADRLWRICEIAGPLLDKLLIDQVVRRR